MPKEVKDNEYRVGVVPSTVRELVDKGHRVVVVESRAGAGAGFADSNYQAAAAEVVTDSDVVFDHAELIVKVNEPLVTECKKLSRGQVLFTYLHLAPDRQQTEALTALGVTAIAYGTVTSPEGMLPLLTPMSEIAGTWRPTLAAIAKTGPRGVQLGGICRGHALVLFQFIRFYHWAFRRQHTQCPKVFVYK